MSVVSYIDFFRFSKKSTDFDNFHGFQRVPKEIRNFYILMHVNGGLSLYFIDAHISIIWLVMICMEFIDFQTCLCISRDFQ